MKPSKWIKAIGEDVVKAIGEDVVIVALFIAWQVYGIQGAGNVLLLFMSVVAVVGTLFFIVVLADTEAKADYKSFKHTPAYRTYKNMSYIVHVAAFAWIGYYWIALGLTLTALITLVAYDRANKEPEPGVVE